MGKVIRLSLFPELEQQTIEEQKTLQSSTIISQEMSLHRQRTLKIENEHLLKGIPREGKLGMPKASPIYLDRIPKIFVPFCNLKSCRTTHACVHFYIHDYKFKQVWNNLEKTLYSLKKYEAVISTDDSVFLDTYLIDNMRNVFKNRVFTAVGQRMGVNVIPSFSCGNPKDLEFYCDGLPEGGCIAVGGMGTNDSRSTKAIFKYCVTEMCKRKRPNMLLVYGSNENFNLDIPIVRIPTFVEDLRKRIKK